MGRFVSADPLGYVDGGNLYQYAGNDPVNLSDPLGLEITRASYEACVSVVEDTGTGIVRGVFEGSQENIAGPIAGLGVGYAWLTAGSLTCAALHWPVLNTEETITLAFAAGARPAPGGSVPLLSRPTLDSRGAPASRPASSSLRAPHAEPAAPSQGFSRYAAAEQSLQRTPNTLAEIEDAIRLNAGIADNTAKSAGVSRAHGRFGTQAHVEFERLNNELNAKLTEAKSRYRVVVEEFRDASGNVVARKAADSLGTDAVIYEGNTPVAGYDLKTGRPWSATKLMEVQRRVSAQVTQIKTR